MLRSERSIGSVGFSLSHLVLPALFNEVPHGARTASGYRRSSLLHTNGHDDLKWIGCMITCRVIDNVTYLREWRPKYQVHAQFRQCSEESLLLYKASLHTCIALIPSHGFSRVIISHKTTPKEYWSHFSLTALARKSSASHGGRLS